MKADSILYLFIAKILLPEEFQKKFSKDNKNLTEVSREGLGRWKIIGGLSSSGFCHLRVSVCLSVIPTASRPTLLTARLGPTLGNSIKKGLKFYSLFLQAWLFKILHMWYHTVLVFLWLVSLSIMPSRSIHVVANGRISFFLMSEYYMYIYIYLHIYNICISHLLYQMLVEMGTRWSKSINFQLEDE